MNGLNSSRPDALFVSLGTQPLFGSGHEEIGTRSSARAAPEQRKGRTMSHWRKLLLRFLAAEDGPTAVEYAVMLALIIVVCIGAITTMGGNANKTFSNVA